MLYHLSSFFVLFFCFFCFGGIGTKRKIEGKIKEKWVQEIKKTVKRISYFFINFFSKTVY